MDVIVKTITDGDVHAGFRGLKWSRRLGRHVTAATMIGMIGYALALVRFLGHKRWFSDYRKDVETAKTERLQQQSTCY